jgi:hypothetical protein
MVQRAEPEAETAAERVAVDRRRKRTQRLQAAILVGRATEMKHTAAVWRGVYILEGDIDDDARPELKS